MNLEEIKILRVSFQEFILLTDTHFLTVSIKCFLCALLQESLQNNDVVLYVSDASVDGRNSTDAHEKGSGRGWMICISISAFGVLYPVYHCLLT